MIIVLVFLLSAIGLLFYLIEMGSERVASFHSLCFLAIISYLAGVAATYLCLEVLFK